MVTISGCLTTLGVSRVILRTPYLPQVQIINISNIETWKQKHHDRKKEGITWYIKNEILRKHVRRKRENQKISPRGKKEKERKSLFLHGNHNNNSNQDTKEGALHQPLATRRSAIAGSVVFVVALLVVLAMLLGRARLVSSTATACWYGSSGGSGGG